MKKLKSFKLLAIIAVSLVFAILVSFAALFGITSKTNKAGTLADSAAVTQDENVRVNLTVSPQVAKPGDEVRVKISVVNCLNGIDAFEIQLKENLTQSTNTLPDGFSYVGAELIDEAYLKSIFDDTTKLTGKSCMLVVDEGKTTVPSFDVCEYIFKVNEGTPDNDYVFDIFLNIEGFLEDDGVPTIAPSTFTVTVKGDSTGGGGGGGDQNPGTSTGNIKATLTLGGAKSATLNLEPGNPDQTVSGEISYANKDNVTASAAPSKSGASATMSLNGEAVSNGSKLKLFYGENRLYVKVVDGDASIQYCITLTVAAPTSINEADDYVRVNIITPTRVKAGEEVKVKITIVNRKDGINSFGMQFKKNLATTNEILPAGFSYVNAELINETYLKSVFEDTAKVTGQALMLVADTGITTKVPSFEACEYTFKVNDDTADGEYVFDIISSVDGFDVDDDEVPTICVTTFTIIVDSGNHGGGGDEEQDKTGSLNATLMLVGNGANKKLDLIAGTRDNTVSGSIPYESRNSVIITVGAVDPKASVLIQFGSKNIDSGTVLNLVEGANYLTVTITNADKNETYNITIYVATASGEDTNPGPAENTDLGATLTLSGGKSATVELKSNNLDCSVSGDVTYANKDNVTANATAKKSGASVSMKLNGEAVSNGSKLKLFYGENRLYVKVTSGSDSAQYCVTITVAAPTSINETDDNVRVNIITPTRAKAGEEVKVKVTIVNRKEGIHSFGMQFKKNLATTNEILPAGFSYVGAELINKSYLESIFEDTAKVTGQALMLVADTGITTKVPYVDACEYTFKVNEGTADGEYVFDIISSVDGFDVEDEEVPTICVTTFTIIVDNGSAAGGDEEQDDTNTNATLMLSGGTSALKNLVSGTPTYTIEDEVAYAQREKVVVSVLPTYKNADVIIELNSARVDNPSTLKLVEGTNTLKVTITTSVTTSETYTITITVGANTGGGEDPDPSEKSTDATAKFEGGADQTFELTPSTTGYELTNNVTYANRNSVKVTVEAKDSNATVTLALDGSSVNSGSTLTLTPGTHTLKVTVENGSDNKTIYEIVIRVENEKGEVPGEGGEDPDPSIKTGLSATLTLSGGKSATQELTSSQLDYTISGDVAYTSKDNVTASVAPSKDGASASMKLNGETVSNGSKLKLLYGENRLYVTVVDGEDNIQYCVTITVAAPGSINETDDYVRVNIITPTRVKAGEEVKVKITIVNRKDGIHSFGMQFKKNLAVTNEILPAGFSYVGAELINKSYLDSIFEDTAKVTGQALMLVADTGITTKVPSFEACEYTFKVDAGTADGEYEFDIISSADGFDIDDGEVPTICPKTFTIVVGNGGGNTGGGGEGGGEDNPTPGPTTNNTNATVTFSGGATGTINLVSGTPNYTLGQTVPYLQRNDVTVNVAVKETGKATASMKLGATTVNSGSTLALTAGTHVLAVTVENSGESYTYNITIKVADANGKVPDPPATSANTDAKVAFSGGVTGHVNLSSGTQDYELGQTVPYLQRNDVTVQVSVVDYEKATAVMKMGGKTVANNSKLALTPGTQVLEVTVTNGTESYTYNITIKVADANGKVPDPPATSANTNATAKFEGGADQTITLTSGTKGYEVTEAVTYPNKDNVKLTVTASDSANATIDILLDSALVANGTTLKLTPGTHLIEVTVWNGSEYYTYEIVIKVANEEGVVPPPDATTSDTNVTVKFSGSINEQLNLTSGTKGYELRNIKYTEKDNVIVTAEPNDKNATADMSLDGALVPDGTKLTLEPGTYILQVTVWNQQEKYVYEIIIRVEDESGKVPGEGGEDPGPGPSIKTGLSATLTLSGGKSATQELTSSQLDYTISGDVAYTSKDNVTVNATVKKSGASVSMKLNGEAVSNGSKLKLFYGENRLYVTVVDGEDSIQYCVTITVAAPTSIEEADDNVRVNIITPTRVKAGEEVKVKITIVNRKDGIHSFGMQFKKNLAVTTEILPAGFSYVGAELINKNYLDSIFEDTAKVTGQALMLVADTGITTKVPSFEACEYTFKVDAGTADGEYEFDIISSADGFDVDDGEVPTICPKTFTIVVGNGSGNTGGGGEGGGEDNPTPGPTTNNTNATVTFSGGATGTINLVSGTPNYTLGQTVPYLQRNDVTVNVAVKETGKATAEMKLGTTPVNSGSKLVLTPGTHVLVVTVTNSGESYTYNITIKVADANGKVPDPPATSANTNATVQFSGGATKTINLVSGTQGYELGKIITYEDRDNVTVGVTTSASGATAVMKMGGKTVANNSKLALTPGTQVLEVTVTNGTESYTYNITIKVADANGKVPDPPATTANTNATAKFEGGADQTINLTSGTKGYEVTEAVTYLNKDNVKLTVTASDSANATIDILLDKALVANGTTLKLTPGTHLIEVTVWNGSEYYTYEIVIRVENEEGVVPPPGSTTNNTNATVQFSGGATDSITLTSGKSGYELSGNVKYADRENVTVTVNTADPNASADMTMGGVLVPDGTKLPLTPGTHVLKVTVWNQQDKYVYEIIIRVEDESGNVPGEGGEDPGPGPSIKTGLSATLTLSGGKSATQELTSSQLDYTISGDVAYTNKDNVTVNATAKKSGASVSMKLNGEAVSNGSKLKLFYGENRLYVTVVDGEDSIQYCVTITVAAPTSIEEADDNVRVNIITPTRVKAGEEVKVKITIVNRKDGIHSFGMQFKKNLATTTEILPAGFSYVGAELINKSYLESIFEDTAKVTGQALMLVADTGITTKVPSFEACEYTFKVAAGTADGEYVFDIISSADGFDVGDEEVPTICPKTFTIVVGNGSGNTGETGGGEDPGPGPQPETNEWLTAGSLTASWQFGENGTFVAPTAKYGDDAKKYTLLKGMETVWSDQTSVTLPTAIGEYTLIVNVYETADYGALTKEFKFSITKPTNSWLTEGSLASSWNYGETETFTAPTAKYGNDTIKYTLKKDGQIVWSDQTSVTLPTEAGNYTLVAEVDETDEYTGLTKEFNFSITKVTNRWITNGSLDSSWQYGESKTFTAPTAKYGNDTKKYTLLKDGTPVWSDQTSVTLPTDKGNYKLVVTVDETDEYTGLTKEFAFSITDLLVEAPTEGTVDTFVYDGDDKTYAFASVGDSANYTVKVTRQDGVICDNSLTQSAVGTYIVTVTLNDPDNMIWKGGPQTGTNDAIVYTFSIRTEIKETDIIFSGMEGLVYDGTPKTISVYITVNGVVLVDGQDYELEYTNNINAGENTAKVTVKGLGDYTSSVEKTFSIAKKKISLPDPGVNTFEFDGNEKTYSPDYDERYLRIEDNKATQKGSYEAKFYLIDTANTEWADGSNSPYKTMDFYITAQQVKAPNALGDDTVFVYDGTPKVYDPYKLNPADYSSTLVIIENNEQTEGGTYTVIVKLANKEGTVWSDTLDTTDKTFTFVIGQATNAWTNSATAHVDDWNYGGTPSYELPVAVYGQVDYKIVNDNKPSDTYTFSSATAVNFPTKAGSYTLTATVTGNDSYAGLSGGDAITITFKINVIKIAKPTASSETFVFNTQMQTYHPVYANPSDVNYLTVTGLTKSASGATDIVFSIKDKDSVCWLNPSDESDCSDTADFTLEGVFNIEKRAIIKPTDSAQTYTYNASTQSYVPEYNGEETKYIMLSNEAHKNANSADNPYKVKVSLAYPFDTEWRDEDGGGNDEFELDFIINKLGVAKYILPENNQIIITESTVYDIQLVPGTEKYITVAGHNTHTTVGQYEATVTLDPNCYWLDGDEENVKTLKYELVGAINAWNPEPSITSEWYYGETPTITRGKAKFGTAVYKYYKNGTNPEEYLDGEPNETTPVGTYTMIVTVEGAANGSYGSLTFTKEFTVKQANNSWDPNPSIADWEYGSTPSTPTAGVKFGNVGDIVYTYFNSEGHEIPAEQITSELAVGTYTLKAHLAGTDNYKELDFTTTFKVTQKIITAPTQGEMSATYDGQPHTFVENISAGQVYSIMFSGGDFKDGDESPVNSGSYFIMVTLPNANYKWSDGDNNLSKSFTLEISPATNAWKDGIEPDITSYSYTNKDPVESGTYTVGEPLFGTITYAYKNSDGTPIDESKLDATKTYPVAPGNYQMIIMVAADDSGYDNYNGLPTITRSFQIKFGTVDILTYNVYDAANNPNGVLTDKGDGRYERPYDENYDKELGGYLFVKGYDVNDKRYKLMTDVSPIQYKVGTYTVVIALSDPVNTAWVDADGRESTDNLTFEFSIIKTTNGWKIVPKIIGADVSSNIPYTGRELLLDTDYTAVPLFGTVEYTWKKYDSGSKTFVDAELSDIVNVGTYKMVAKVIGTEAYDGIPEYSVTFNIVGSYITAPEADETEYEYGAVERVFTFTSFDSTAYKLVKVDEGDMSFTIDGNTVKATNAGEFKVKLVLLNPESTSWDGEEPEYTFTITKLTIVIEVPNVTIFAGKVPEKYTIIVTGILDADKATVLADIKADTENDISTVVGDTVPLHIYYDYPAGGVGEPKEITVANVGDLKFTNYVVTIKDNKIGAVTVSSAGLELKADATLKFVVTDEDNIPSVIKVYDAAPEGKQIYLTAFRNYMTAGKVLEEFVNNKEDLTIVNIDGDPLEDGDDVGTGAVIALKDNPEVYVTVVLFGDLNGDGMVDNADRSSFLNLRLGKYHAENEEYEWDPIEAIIIAGDMNLDGMIDNADRYAFLNLRLGTLVDPDDYDSDLLIYAEMEFPEYNPNAAEASTVSYSGRVSCFGEEGIPAQELLVVEVEQTKPEVETYVAESEQPEKVEAAQSETETEQAAPKFEVTEIVPKLEVVLGKYYLYGAPLKDGKYYTV